MTDHTFSTECTACDSTEWTRTQLSFKIDPFALTLVVHGPETLHIRYSLRSENKLKWWNEGLAEDARANPGLLDIQVRTQRHQACIECVYADSGIMQNSETCVLEDEALFWPGVLIYAFAVDGHVLRLDHDRGTTEVFVPLRAWRDIMALFPLSWDDQRYAVDVVWQVATAAPNEVLEGQCIQARPGDQAGVELTPEAEEAWQRISDDFGNIRDAEGCRLVSAWQNERPVVLQKGKYWFTGCLRVYTTYSGLVLELRRANGVLERMQFKVGEKSRFLAQELAGKTLEVLVKYLPTEKTNEGTHLDLDNNVISLTYGSTIELIELPATSGLVAALADLPESTPCILEHVKPTSCDKWRVWWWNTRKVVWNYREVVVVPVAFLLLLLLVRWIYSTVYKSQ